MPRIYDRTTLVQLGNLTVADSYDGLRIRFSITKTLKSEPNSGNIEIYGLNRTSVAQYLAADRDLRIRLLAGYDNAPSLLFDGFPVKKEGLVFEAPPGERILKIKAKDGLRRYEKARVNLSLSEASTNEDLIAAAAGSLGLPLGTVELPEQTVELTQGAHLNGFTKDVLDRLATSANADWSIQDGKFQFIAKNGRARGRGPLFSDRLGNIVGDVRRKDKGVEVTSFIGGAINPGVIFEVRQEGGFYNGTYKASEVKYTGDSFYDNDFFAVVTGVPYETETEARVAKQAIVDRISRTLGEGAEAVGTNLSKILDKNYVGPPIDDDFN